MHLDMALTRYNNMSAVAMALSLQVYSISGPVHPPGDADEPRRSPLDDHLHPHRAGHGPQAVPPGDGVHAHLGALSESDLTEGHWKRYE